MKKNVRTRLAEERKHRKWSQQQAADAIGTTQRNVSRWERGITTPGPYFRAKLEALFGLSARELGLLELSPDLAPAAPPVPASPPLPPVVQQENFWFVPYPRNPFFTGREDSLRDVRSMLCQRQTPALALSGLGGMGKTQIALEYTYRYRAAYRAIFWVRAATWETLLADVIAIAEHLHLPARQAAQHKQVLKAVQDWLTTHDAWLLVLDNADDRALVLDFVPAQIPGHLLLTTRAQALGSLARRLDVEKMGMLEGALFLLQRSHLLLPAADLAQVDEEHLAAAEAIAIEMDFLPLALDQAGAYIEEVGCHPRDYLALYRTHRARLLERRGQLPGDHPDPVATTWSLNFAQIELTNPAAADLLRLCAFLEPETIPEEFCRADSLTLTPALQELADDALHMNAALAELRKFSLVHRQCDAGYLHLHRLVQIVLKDAMPVEVQRQWVDQAIRVSHSLFPRTSEVATWPLCQRYLPQAQQCSILQREYTIVAPEAASLLFRTAQYVRQHGLYEQAEPLYQQSVQIWKHLPGPADPGLASTLNGLANLHREQGRYQQAEEIFQQALHMRERLLGPDHVEVARVLSNLAVTYEEQGKYEQAEPLARRALEIWEDVLGPDDPDVAGSLCNLALICEKLGKHEQAGAHYQRALEIWERALGPQHPFLAHPLNGLANLQRQQKDFGRAQALYQRALALRESALDEQHPDIAETLDDFAQLQEAQQHIQEALRLYQRALVIREKILGASHPATLATRERYTHLLATESSSPIAPTEKI